MSRGPAYGAITQATLASFADSPDERLRELMRALVAHLHAFAAETGLSEDEWRALMAVLAQTGQLTDDQRQEFVLWSDVLGRSMLVDAIAHPAAGDATGSTVLGPFLSEGAPLREHRRAAGGNSVLGPRPGDEHRRAPARRCRCRRLAAHLHLAVSAPGHQTLVTHIFDADSPSLDSDAVFAVKPSLIRPFQARAADDPERPPGVEGAWCSVANDIVLASVGFQ
ncbi:MAG TPA: dioxygenase [Solirubrobacteraceae bacterium]|jgi:hypothetical protein|nr:dioxygenase [Solirubrobacteraceae bacterium]